MSAHTDGPWEICYLDTPIDEIGAYVQKCVDVGPGEKFYFLRALRADGAAVDVAHIGNGPTSEANAKLIAAAPDLLEELENCADLLKTCFPDAPADSCIGAAIASVNAAIAKATSQ